MNRKRRTIIADAWEDYRTKVVPPDAGPGQIRDLRNAFYGGALSVVSGMLALLQPGSEPTADDLTIADDVDAELRAHMAEAKLLAQGTRRWGRPPS